MTDGIDRHKARYISGLRSRDFSSAHPEKAPVPGRHRAERDGTKGLSKSMPFTANQCHSCGIRT